MNVRIVGRAFLWLVALAAFAFATLMAWFGISTFGRLDTQTFLIRVVFVGAFLLSAILMEHSIRSRDWDRQKLLLSIISGLGVLETASIVWINR